VGHRVRAVRLRRWSTLQAASTHFGRPSRADEPGLFRDSLKDLGEEQLEESILEERGGRSAGGGGCASDGATHPVASVHRL
jgi:hypothetical protein